MPSRFVGVALRGQPFVDSWLKPHSVRSRANDRVWFCILKGLRRTFKLRSYFMDCRLVIELFSSIIVFLRIDRIFSSPLRIIFALSLILASFGPAAAQPRASTLWGNLQPGPHAVGFKTVFAYDGSRPPLLVDRDNKAIVPVPTARQMQLSVWYPARHVGREPFLSYEAYVHLMAQELQFKPPSPEERERSVQAFMKEPLSLGASADKLKALMRVQTAAVKDAAPTQGQFPLVIYAHVAPALNSIMCEYLASHGFVVAAVPVKGSFEYALDVGLTGVETQISDIEFAKGVLGRDPQVARDKIAVIGMSFGAISALGFASRNSDVDALVSLDGGIGSPFGASVVQRTPFYSLSRITAPLLHLYGPNVPGTDLTFINGLKYSRRHLIAFPALRHTDFVNYGMLEHLVPNIQGKPTGDSKSGFEWVCRFTLRFLNAYLKADRESRVLLDNPANGNETIFTAQTKESLQPPPTAAQLRAMIEEKGVGSVVALHNELTKTDPQPFTQQSLSDAVRWLGEKGDWKSAREIVDLRLKSYPESAWANYAAAEVYRRLDDIERARKLYEEALRFLPTDFEPETDIRRRAIYEGARRNLQPPNNR